MTPMHIIIDSREQTPWSWDPHLVRTSIAGLDAGDYALATDCTAVSGRETMLCAFSVERKSLDDFIGTIGSGWERFKNELHRMREYPARVVIVEGDFVQCCFAEGSRGPEHRHGQITPQFVASRVAWLAMAGVSVLFAGDAACAAGLAYRVMVERMKGVGE
jgi:ERCC4-type nuclease